jgi:hypothetical protein
VRNRFCALSKAKNLKFTPGFHQSRLGGWAGWPSHCQCIRRSPVTTSGNDTSYKDLNWFNDMKNDINLVVILTAVVAVGCSGKSEVPENRDDEIEYRGEKIKLTKPYSDYDDYKNDPDNIDSSELPRVQRLVCEAPIAPSFVDRWQMLQAVSGVAFPGYGSWQFGDKTQADGSVISGHGIEVPHAGKARILVFRSSRKSFDLIDDFIAPFDASIENMIVKATIKDDKLIYATSKNTTVLTRDFREKSH